MARRTELRDWIYCLVSLTPFATKSLHWMEFDSNSCNSSNQLTSQWLKLIHLLYFVGSEQTSICLMSVSGELNSTSFKSFRHSLVSFLHRTCSRTSATWSLGWILSNSTWRYQTAERLAIKRTTTFAQSTSILDLETANGLQLQTRTGEEFKRCAKRTTSITCMAVGGRD